MKFLLYNKHAINQAPIVGVFVVLMMLLSGTAYEFLYHLHRSQTVELWAIFVLLFTMYLFFTRFNIAQTYYYPLLLVAVLFRVLSLATISNLSDDCYRFVWDGRVWIGGINPFLYLPIHFLDGTYTGQPIAGINQLLFEQLNSPHYYSVYPPVCQYLFAFAAKLSKGNLLANFMWLKIFLLLFEMGTLALLHSFCTSNTISRQNVLQYALCPLVIVELVGNTHFEAACIFFMLLAIYYWQRQKNTYSAVALGLAVSIKLLPLISLPLLLRRLGFAQTVQYGSIAIGIFLLTFTPLLDNHLWQILLSVGLYFHTFSFNASIFYVVRWVLNTLSGTDATALAGYSMGFVTLLCILYYVFQEKYTSLSNKTNLGSFMLGLLFVWSSYLSLATTVHPWYVVPLVAWSVFTPYRFPLLWSLLVVGSYATYNNQTYSQNGYLIFAEYALVWIYAIWEYKKNRAIPANKMPYTNKV